MAISSLNLSQGMPISTSEVEVPGFFGKTLQSAMESVAKSGPAKDLDEDEIDIYGLASLISANLLQLLNGDVQQDVHEWISELMGSGAIDVDQIGASLVEMTPEMLEELANKIAGIAQDQSNVNPGEFKSLVDKVLNEIRDYAVNQNAVNEQLKQDAPDKIAGELRVNYSEQSQENEEVHMKYGKEAETKSESDVQPKFSLIGADTKIEQDVRLVFEEVQTDNVAKTVLERIESAVKSDSKQLFIKLQPDFLGGIAMKLRMTEGGLVAKIVASNEQTQSILNTQVADLENSLREKGIPVASMEISYNNAMNDNMSRQGNAAQDGNKKNKSNSRRISALDFEEPQGLMDLYEAMMASSEMMEEEVNDYHA